MSELRAKPEAGVNANNYSKKNSGFVSSPTLISTGFTF